jgi:dienelactone hydrolase
VTTRFAAIFSILLLLCGGTTAWAETPEEWVKLLSRVHGGFGSFLPVGIRIGEDALKRLDAKPRELSVILLHGSGGVSGFVDDWARELNRLGVAAFILDSFTGRGIVNTNSDQDQLSRLVMILDAYRALELLSKHPRIEPERILVMGFSRGGGAAHWSAQKRFLAMHGPTGGQQFAGHIAFYPTCNRFFVGWLDVVEKPIRVFHGAADDYIPAAGCRSYVDQLQKAGKDATFTEYADAHHVFDWPALKNPLKLPQAQTTHQCPPLEESSDGRIVNSQTKQPFTYASDPCVQRGATIAYNAQGHAEALKAVKEFVTARLQPK